MIGNELYVCNYGCYEGDEFYRLIGGNFSSISSNW
jgi:hypothetical protein